MKKLACIALLIAVMASAGCAYGVRNDCCGCFEASCCGWDFYQKCDLIEGRRCGERAPPCGRIMYVPCDDPCADLKPDDPCADIVVEEAPATETPAAGTPAAGTPAAGTPAAGTPADAAPVEPPKPAPETAPDEEPPAGG